MVSIKTIAIGGIVFAGLVGAASIGYAQGRAQIGRIGLPYASVSFVAACGNANVQVRAGLFMNYQSADDAQYQLQVLYPQCTFQQIDLPPLPPPRQ